MSFEIDLIIPAPLSILKWVVNIIDHHTKFCYMHPIHSKTVEEVVSAFSTFCMLYGYPKKLLTDNGLEFRNNRLESFAKENGITIYHGSPKSPTERSNRTFKEDLRAILLTEATRQLKNWCKTMLATAYTMNITHHRVINK